MIEVLNKKDFEKVKGIVYLLEQKGNVTPKEAKEKCGKSTATTVRYLRILVDSGYVIQEGNTNNLIYINTLKK